MAEASTETTEEALQTEGSTVSGEENKSDGQQNTADKLFSDNEGDKESKEVDKESEKVEDKSKDSDGDTDKVPESYSDFNFPEGMEIDSDDMEAFKQVAGDLELSQENAQKFTDYQVGIEQERKEQQKSDWVDTVDGWDKASQEDSEFGGEMFMENMSIASNAFKQFGNSALKDALVASGMGNHPEFIRLMIGVGKGMSEDQFNPGGSSAGKTDPAKVLFENQN